MSSSMDLHQNTNEKLHIPARLLSHKLFTTEIFLTQHYFIYVLITENYEFYELLHKNIMNKVNLIEHLGDICKGESDEINLKLYFRYVDGEVDEFYLLQIRDTLIVIKRSTMEVLELHTRIMNYNVINKDSCPYIKIRFNEESGKEALITNFSRTAYDMISYEQCIKDQSERQNVFFSDSLVLLENRIKNIVSELTSYEELTKKSVLEEVCEARFGSDEVVSEFPDEKLPIIKYGDTWTKIHNEKVIIGIPILNCTYSRSLEIFDIKPILNNSKHIYSYNLYTLGNDAFEFNEHLEELIEPTSSPVISTNFNRIDENWMICKDNILESGHSGIVVIQQSLIGLDYSVAYEIFLLYKFDHNTNIYTQQIHIGTVNIDQNILYDQNSIVQMQRNELYKDFLTVVSSSRQESFTLKIERRQLINFLIDKLKFIVIANGAVFYKTDSVWANMLVRCDYNATKPENECHLKIFSQRKYHINAFIRCLVHEYGDRIQIKSAPNFVNNFIFYKNVLMEIGMKIEYLKKVGRLDKLMELYTGEMITEMVFME